MAGDCIVYLLRNARLSTHGLEAMTEPVRRAHRRLKLCDLTKVDAPALTEVMPVPARRVRLEGWKELSRYWKTLDILNETKVDQVLMDDNQAMATFGLQGPIVVYETNAQRPLIASQ